MKVVIVSSDIADTSLYEKSKLFLSNKLAGIDCEYVDNDADAMFFASGGSEQTAIEVAAADKPVVLLATNQNNSYAAATEVLSYLISKKYSAKLFNLSSIKQTADLLNLKHSLDDVNVIANSKYIHETVANHNLINGKVAVIGNVSKWLVNSEVTVADLYSYFAIELLNIQWNELPNFFHLAPDYELYDNFPQCDISLLMETSKVYRLLKNVVANYNLQGITVECFPMAMCDKVTACLPLSLLNASGCPAACEGDITALVGMMYIKALTGIVPWQANLVEIDDNTALWAHCTAPLNLVNNINVVTHFETNIGTAIQADIENSYCTIFRFDKSLKHFFLCEAEVLASPKFDFACRTQLQIKLPDDAANILRTNPLGNHHLILPGKYADMILSVK